MADPARHGTTPGRLARRAFLREAVTGAAAMGAAGYPLLNAEEGGDRAERDRHAEEQSPEPERLSGQAAKPSGFLAGVDANYAWEMTGGHLDQPLWTYRGKPVRLFPFLRSIGAQLLRVRLLTVEKGSGSLSAATDVARAGAAAGLTPLVVFFLSDGMSDFGKSPLAARWKDTTVAQRAQAIERYAESTVRHFQEAGLRVPVYAIGNESDFGFAGLFASDLLGEFLPLTGGGFPIFGEPDKPGSPKAGALLHRLQKGFWPRASILAAACARGIRTADPRATLLMHVAQSREPVFCEAFFRTMREHGVSVDYAGLSYYPAITGDLDFALTRRTVAHLADSLKMRTVLCESAYPSKRPTGLFAFMKHEMSRFPFTPRGQKDWLLDVLKWTLQDPNVASFVYWSPEWFRSHGLWDPMALFDPEGNAKPAIEAFREFKQWRETRAAARQGP
ncbi:MAG: glycosyl hydrolase 53 family protein [Planctomycetes bacterium]|nr:glycosyl hydrolase 53 family protein [Planctomycetota bacterium]